MDLKYKKDEVAIAIMHLNDFMNSLPSCFQHVSGGKIYHDPNEANLFLDERKLFINAKKKIIKFKGKEEFSLFKQRLLTVPTYLSVTLSEEDVDVEKLTGTWHHFMVCVNPKHPAVRSELIDNLRQCQELIEQDKFFSFHIRLGPSLSRWYEIVNDMPFYTSRSFNSSICLTNFMEEKAMCYSPVLWTTLFPIMLLICGPYIVYRVIACKQFSVRVRASITLVIANDGPGDSKDRDHLCVIKRPINPFVSTTTQQPTLYELELDATRDVYRPKRPGLYFRPF